MNTTLEKPFLRIADACAATGLSQHFLRAGCRNGSIPCVKSGNGCADALAPLALCS